MLERDGEFPGVAAASQRALWLSLSPDPKVPGGVQGNAEITVQGTWALDIVVTGSAGRGETSVPITATAPPALPTWLGWVIGFIPLYGLFVFLLLQRGRKARQV